MKILIIGFAKIKYMPYLNLYLDNIDTEKNEVHILYWDRDNNWDRNLPKAVKPHVFSKNISDDATKYKKILPFLCFARKAKELIKKEKFDFIISLTTIPTVLLSDILLLKYKENYIFDYRDYTFERFTLYRKLVGKLISCSAMTVYSSKKHLDFLPESPKLHIAHNFIKASLSHRKENVLRKVEGQPIQVSYWGLLRNEEFNRNIIDKFAKDSRFEISFYGKEQQTVKNLKKYCEENEFSNIHFYGEYQEEDRYTFAERTDILYNLYSVNGTEGMAMGNKFFDGVIFGIPQICTKGSYMGEKAEEYGVGKAVDVNLKNLTDGVYVYYNSIDKIKFSNNCDKVLENIINDYKNTTKLIRKYCLSEKDGE